GSALCFIVRSSLAEKWVIIITFQKNLKGIKKGRLVNQPAFLL
ncbi:MAG: hypothetical protein ACJA0X_002197, partial [Cyclobacteriaceae bacterium]